MSKDVRKALMIAKGPVSSGYLPPGNPQRTANLARHMEGNHPDVPSVMYHATNKEDFSAFKLPGRSGTGGNAIFTNADPNEAEYFTHGADRSRILPVHVSAKNPWDENNAEHTESLKTFLTKNFDKLFPRSSFYNPAMAARDVDAGDHGLLEHPDVRRWMKKQGHDGFFTKESKGAPRTLAVFDPRQIKSATGNNGQYDPNEPEITKAEGGEVDTNRNAAFKGLASAQRGDPEMAMVKAQGSLGKLNKSGTSVLSSLLEHVGDLTHRISQYPASQPSLALENAPPKIKKALMALRPYTRDRMDLEDHVPSDMPELKEYADAHAALPVYNDMQRHARDAAVALGNKDFNAANAHLTKLHDAISDGSFGNRIMEFNSPIAKAEGGPVDDPSDPDYHAKVHQDLMWHSAHNRSSNYGAALYHHLMKQPDQGPITKFYEQTVYPILKNHGFPKPPEGPGDVENPKYLQAVSDVVKNWRDVPRNKEDVHKAEGGAASLPVLPERPPLDVLRRMDAGAKDAWRRDRDVRLGRNYHPPGSPEHDANLMDFMEGAHPLFFKEPGVPRPVYHATNKDIRRFIPGGTAREEDMESGPATWLTFDPTNNPAAHHIGGYKGEYKEGTNVMPLYANIKNPLILNNKDALKAARNKFSIKSNAFPMLLTKDTKNALQEAGHDGIVYQKEAGALDGDEVLAFDNHQLKSALGNRGVYDKQDPTVDYQRGGYITKAEGGPIAAPVGGFPGMKAMPTLSAPQNSQAAQAMMAAIPRMQESGPVSNTGYAPYTPTALPQRLAAVGVQPKVVPMSAEVAALKKQFPTATMDQLSEYNRAIADGGDPKATLSLMKAYSPASNYTSHQPWSPDFKGFDYKRSRPTDEFGNPVGWTPTAEDEASRQKSLAVSGGKAGYAPLEFPDQYRPDDEYIMNNPWTYGMDSLGGNVMPGEIGTRASERSSQGPTVVDANASYQEGKKAAADAAISKIESMYNPENIGALGPVDANQARMDAVTRAAQTQGMGAARSLGGDSLPGRQSSYFSTPDNFTLNNALQTGFSALGVTPLAPLGYLANAFLTGTNAIPQAGDTGSRALNAIAQQGRMTDWGADAVNWGWRQLGGEAMPARATGGRAQACKEARKAIMIARAMGGRIGKADGGGIDDAAPIPTPVTSGPKTVFTSGGKQYEFAVTPPDKQITSKDLAAQTTDALQQHLSLPYMQQVANSKAAANKLAPYVGREKNGAVKPFLTMNAKLEKASAGYEAGPRYDAQAPLQLEGGVGVETIGMPLAPAYEHNKFKVCPNSAVCKDECLGVTSGNYAQADWWPRQNSKNRTHAFMSEPGALAVQLHNEIQNAKSAAAMRGNRLAVRLNVLSDIDPRVHETLIKANPDVDFYDYTKMNYDPIATETRNHHYTYSSTGLSQPAGVNGLTEGVENKHQNWKQMRQRLDTGSNVAMVFSHKEHLPREVYDRETDKTYRVVDGTTHDYRPLDKQAEGSNGVIIGLQNLNKTGKQDNAYKDSNGFVVHYDPQVQMVPNAKTGLPTKTPVKGPSPGVNKAGKSLPRPTFPTNYRVEIAPQGGEGRADGGAVNHGQQKIHPDYAAQQFHNYHIFNGPESAPLAKGERPAQYAYGGPVEGDRELDDSGFYNAAAEAAQGIPQAKGTPQQMMSMVQNAPGTQETMKWSGADQAFAGQPIVSKDDLVNHFQTNAPKLEETQLGLRSRTIEYDVAVLRYRNAIKQGAPKEEQDRLGAIANSFIDSPEPKYKKYTIPGGENYREILLKAPPNKSPERDRMSEIENRRADIQKELMKLNDDELYRHLSTEGTANVEDFTKEKIRLLSETENLKNEYKSLVPKTQNIDYNSSHWEGHPNVVAHLRMSDRTLPQTNEKALHLEEVQSDWGQDGKRGFKKTDEELRGLRDEMLALHKNYLDLHGSGAPPDQLQAAESKYNSAMNKFNNGFKAKTPEGPYVGNTNKWTDLALKRALIEAARGGHDKLIWTPGEEQALRYDLKKVMKMNDAAKD
jgi:hypothetical protein